MSIIKTNKKEPIAQRQSVAKPKPTKNPEQKSADCLSSAMPSSILCSLSSVIEQMPGYIYWKNTQSEYMGCNRRLAELSGLAKPSDIAGMTDHDLDWSKEQANQLIKDDLYVIDTQKTNISEYQLPIKNKQGQFIWMKTEKAPLYQGTEVVGIVAVATDITDEKRLIKKAKQDDTLGRAFINNMQHDIRTPFNGIWGIANYLYRTETDPRKKELLGEITLSAKELLDYCNQILDFSKVELKVSPVLEVRFNLYELVETVINTERPAIRYKGLSFSISINPQIPKEVIGDSCRLHKILINLMGNAIKFTEEGRISFNISLTKKQNETILLKFDIADTGIGIPKEKQERIYEKFAKVNASNKGAYKGLGIGLAIVKQYIQEVGGKIELTSKKGKGSVFSCTLPFKLPLTHKEE